MSISSKRRNYLIYINYNMKKLQKDSLGDRMKVYEGVTKLFLMKRTPIIIRLDGKAFHTFTRGFDKPHDDIIRQCMNYTMLSLCENTQGVRLGYTQSDEISLLITDYKEINTDVLLKYNIQKIVSTLASQASNYFNKSLMSQLKSVDESKKVLINKKLFKAAFDCRVFNIPKDDVCNYFLWRQQDATRNSISGYGQKYFSQKELNGLKSNQIQEKLFTEKGINWNNIPTSLKRGSCCVKKLSKWFIDKEIPIFSQDRNYIDSEVYYEIEGDLDND